MSKFINRVVLRGRVATAPALRILPSDAAVCTFQLATPESNNHTEFHKLVGYYERALEATQYFAVGDVIYVEGRIRTRQYLTEEDKRMGRTKKRSVLEIVADEWVLCSKAGKVANNEATKSQAVDAELLSDSVGAEQLDGSTDDGAVVPFL